MMRKAPLVVLLSVALAGCKGVGPTYDGISPDRSFDRWGSELSGTPSRTTDALADAAWWRRFKDAELDSLVSRLADSNLDLKTAAERVIQGTRQRQVDASQGLPHVDGQSQTLDSRLSPNGFLLVYNIKREKVIKNSPIILIIHSD